MNHLHSLLVSWSFDQNMNSNKCFVFFLSMNVGNAKAFVNKT